MMLLSRWNNNDSLCSQNPVILVIVYMSLAFFPIVFDRSLADLNRFSSLYLYHSMDFLAAFEHLLGIDSNPNRTVLAVSFDDRSTQSYRSMLSDRHDNPGQLRKAINFRFNKRKSHDISFHSIHPPTFDNILQAFGTHPCRNTC